MAGADCRYESQEPYLRAKVEVLKELSGDSVEMTALSRNAHRQFQEIIKLNPALPDQVKIAAINTEAGGNLTDLIAGNLNLTLDERQKLIETVDVKERLNRLQPLLNRELEVSTLSSKIQNDVASTMAKSQRDFSCVNRFAPSSVSWAKLTRWRRRRTISVSRSRRRRCPRKSARLRSRKSSGFRRCPRWSRNTPSRAPILIGFSDCLGARPAKTPSIWRRRSAS